MIQVNDFNEVHLGAEETTALTIGNFDGCHLGHQKLTEATLAYSARLGALPTALTFKPRPDAFFRREPSESLLFTDAQKTRSLAELGIALQIVQRFDAGFSQLSHEQFYTDYVKAVAHAAALVVGDDFRFGFKRHGDGAYLLAKTTADGTHLQIGAAVDYAGARISSSRIRTTLQEQGDVTAAALMLGRPYLVEGRIIKGDQLGRQLGFPTANLSDIAQLLPRLGVYAGYVWLSDLPEGPGYPSVTRRPVASIPAVFNLGLRPTLGQPTPQLRVEAHLLRGVYGPDALYGLRAGYYFAHRLRAERRFPDLNELKQQIDRDVTQAQHLLADA